MYISRLALENWKNFKVADADLARRVFLIGPNASGKSNLLDAFRFLRDVAGGGLGRAVDEARGGVSRLRCLFARQSSSITVDVTLSRQPGVAAWRYVLEFTQDANRSARVKREEVFDGAGVNRLQRPDDADRGDTARLSQTALEQIAFNKDFREVAEFFATISYQHLVPQVVRDPQGFSPGPVQSDPYGRDLLMRIWKTPAKTREAWLRRIARALQSAVPQLERIDIEQDSEGTPHLVARYRNWRPHPARQDESQFSDGTLRLFGLMWSMFEGTGPLLLEEPELSLHPEVVRAVPRMLDDLQDEIRKMKRRVGFEKRQVVVSTHSEELLMDPGIGSREVLRIEPTAEGSKIRLADDQDQALMSRGLTAAEVLLPKSAPTGEQLIFTFG